MLTGNPILFALLTYGVTILVALGVAGIITLIHKAVASRGKKPVKETTAEG